MKENNKEETARLKAKKIKEGHAVADRIAKLLEKNAHKCKNLQDK